ncbi:MAG: ABC transporter permease, partial [Armatimonadota bacterium]|nr:ABC transporter permease [Armatimonadota bacterium]
GNPGAGQPPSRLGAYAGSSIPAGVAAGGACGFLNGVLVVRGRIPPFIATLGMLGIARGLVLAITGGGSISEMAPGFETMAGGRVWGVPLPLFVVASLALLLWVVMERTALGRYAHAIGGNREATRLSGVAVERHLTTIFVLAGLCSGLAGVLLLSRVGVAMPTAGEGYELDAVAAAVIGGASLAGGEGGIGGTLIGAFLMGVLRNGCNLLNMSEGWQRVTIGLLIVGAVFWDQVRRRARES